MFCYVIVPLPVDLECGLDIAAGSLLPTHSDNHQCYFTGKQIKVEHTQLNMFPTNNFDDSIGWW